MKLRSNKSTTEVSPSTPAALLPAKSGIAKTKNKSTKVTLKVKNGSPKARVKLPRSSQKKPANTYVIPGNKAALNSNNAQSSATKNSAGLAVDSAVSSKASLAIGPAVKVTTTSRPRNKTNPEKRECVVCTNSKYLGRNNANFPKFSNCDHEPLTCTECITKHALIRLKARRVDSTNRGPPNFWSAVTCPQCNVRLTETDIRSSLSRVDVKKISEMVTVNKLHSDKRWVWCVSDTCFSGQIHKKPTKKDTVGRKVTCVKCGVKSCFAHRQVWHEGLTCAQYDDRNPKSESIRSSEERIRNMTKKCPTAGCGWRIQKAGGCSSMQCKCILLVLIRQSQYSFQPNII